MCVCVWWCTFRESYLRRVCFVWFNYGVIHDLSTIYCDHITYCKLATGRSLLILFAYHSVKRQFSMAYLLPVAVISQTASLLSAEELSIITTRYRPNTPPGGHMTTTVSAEPTLPTIRPHSLKSDTVGFGLDVKSGGMSFTPTKTSRKRWSEDKIKKATYHAISCDRYK